MGSGCTAIRRRKDDYAVHDHDAKFARHLKDGSVVSKGPPSAANVSRILVGPPSEKSSLGSSRPSTPNEKLKRKCGSMIADALDHPDARADDIVVCEAERPDWNHSDFMVFNFSGTQASEAASRTVACSDKEEPLNKCGVFFSKRTKTLGQWQLNGNVLKLSWGKSRRVDSLLAVESERHFVNTTHHMTLKVMQPIVSPIWFKPDFVHSKYNSVDAIAENFECPICLFELWKFPAGTLRYHSKRACSHYLHITCSSHMCSLLKGSKQEPTCPTCGAAYNSMKPMPDVLTDPRQWFAACDVDFSGELDETEIIEGLGAVLPLARDKLVKMVRRNWRIWDKDGGGSINLREFLDPDGGLLAYVLGNVKNLQRHHHGGALPALDRDPRGWFEYWDRDRSGTLEKAEVVRALVRTLCMDEAGNPVMAKAHHLREVAASLWESLGYSPFEALEFEEFVRPFGLMDQILHNHTQTSYFGDDDEMVLLT